MGSGNNLQRQKKGPLELRRRVKVTQLGGKRGNAGSSVLKAFKGGDFRGAPRGDPSRIFINFPSVFLQGPGLHLLVSTGAYGH